MNRLQPTTTLHRRHCLLAGMALAGVPALAQPAFDHGHAAWTALLKKHVLPLRGGQASQVRYAVNCASIGCPALREEAFTADRLEAQLDEQALRFMSDRSRNRYDAQRSKLEVSKIFDWFGEDFRLGHRSIGSLTAFFARYADPLADAPADRALIRAQKAEVGFLDYDWKLNGAGG